MGLIAPDHHGRAAKFFTFWSEFEKTNLQTTLSTYDQQRFHRVDKAISLFRQ
jgi:hypothetical protein